MAFKRSKRVANNVPSIVSSETDKMSEPKGEVTLLLERMSHGDRSAEEALIEHVYFELHRIATAHLHKERSGHILQPTALVNQAYMRMCGSRGIAYHDRSHFFRIAARLMRRILVDIARHEKTVKGGVEFVFVQLEEGITVAQGQTADALEINDLIGQLEKLSPRQAAVVEMRYYAGLSDEEIAAALGKDARTIRRDWAMARAWFRKQMKCD